MPELEDKKPFVIELNNWKMRDFRAFISAVKEERWEDAFSLLARVIVSWPFEQAINPETIADLGLEDLATAIRAVNMAVGNAFTQGN